MSHHTKQLYTLFKILTINLNSSQDHSKCLFSEIVVFIMTLSTGCRGKRRRSKASLWKLVSMENFKFWSIKAWCMFCVCWVHITMLPSPVISIILMISSSFVRFLIIFRLGYFETLLMIQLNVYKKCHYASTLIKARLIN